MEINFFVIGRVAADPYKITFLELQIFRKLNFWLTATTKNPSIPSQNTDGLPLMHLYLDLYRSIDRHQCILRAYVYISMRQSRHARDSLKNEPSTSKADVGAPMCSLSVFSSALPGSGNTANFWRDFSLHTHALVSESSKFLRSPDVLWRLQASESSPISFLL